MAEILKPGLTGEHFAHPFDRAGMRQLLSQLDRSESIKNQIEKLQTEAEEEFYLLNIADNIKLGPRQGASIYRAVAETAKVLCIPVPHVFLDTNPQINAYALGGDNPSIVLTSALVDSFPEDELRCVIAHELGHIVCQHTFYRLISLNFDSASKLASLIPFVGPLFSLGLQWSLFDWFRKSELSADRAALLATQDINVVQRCILRLAGGSTRISAELSSEAFREQANEFVEKMQAKQGASITERCAFLFSGFMLQHAMSTHPWPAVRLNEVARWHDSAQYAKLISGQYESALLEAASQVNGTGTDLVAPVGEDIGDYISDVGKAAGEKVWGWISELQKQRVEKK